jgi:hypothetical protein
MFVDLKLRKYERLRSAPSARRQPDRLPLAIASLIIARQITRSVGETGSVALWGSLLPRGRRQVQRLGQQQHPGAVAQSRQTPTVSATSPSAAGARFKL